MIGTKIRKFTVLPNGAGFTDQLSQLKAFYRLGVMMKMEYVYYPFVSARSDERYSKLEKSTWDYVSRSDVVSGADIIDLYRRLNRCQDIYNGLGIRAYLSCKYGVFNKTVIFTKIKISDDLLVGKSQYDISVLKSEVEKRIEIQCSLYNEVIPVFVLVGKRRAIFTLIASENFSKKLDIFYGYECKLNAKKIDAVFHLRLGDTACYETPWDTHICVNRRKKEFMNESLTKQYLENGEYITDAEYFNCLKLIVDANCIKSMKVFSDGYEIAYKIVESSAKKIGYESRKLMEIKKRNGKYYNDRLKNMFLNYKNEMYIGTSNIQLRKLVAYILGASVVVTSSRQRMIVKFCATIGIVDSRLLILYKKRKPNYRDIVGADTINMGFIDVDSYIKNKY